MCVCVCEWMGKCMCVHVDRWMSVCVGLCGWMGVSLCFV